MKNRKYLPILFLAFLTIVAGVLTSFYLSSLKYRQSPDIVLPERSDVTIEIDDGIQRENQQAVKEVTVSRDNVKPLLQKLARPPEYMFTVVTTIYTESAQAQYEAMGYVRGQVSKIVQYENGSPSNHTVVTPNSVYLWKEGATNFYTVGKGNFTYDDFARQATYEDLLEKPIQSAQISSVDGQACIEAVAFNETTGCEEVYVIGIYNGLLKSTEIQKDGVTLAKSQITVATVEAIEDVDLMLPNGLLPTE